MLRFLAADQRIDMDALGVVFDRCAAFVALTRLCYYAVWAG